MVYFALLLAVSAADFNGRWNLVVENDPRSRVWWLDVKAAGTPNIEGRFVGAPGGSMDNIPKIEIEGDQLHWVFERGYVAGSKDKQKAHYRARIQKGRMVGTMEIEGYPQMTKKFSGGRAPVINEVDDGKWKPGKPVELFNGKDTSGWECKVQGHGIEWRVENGALANNPKAADITSIPKFWNFKLHAEYRLKPHSNSGIGLRGRYEVQIYDDYGQPVSKHGNGALYSRIIPTVNASLKPGEWQTFDITLIGRQVTIVLNGKTIIDHKEIEGFTAMATDVAEDKPGPITLQGDHGPVEFRKLTVTPLTR
ncbi:MAG: DUF1080 domain-containing protein [Bryobacterales bacterium]|nr:DUF1080 domain-containing protein [Bryobacterales bacterium]